MTTHTRTPREQVALIAEQIGSSLEPDNEKWTNRFKIGSRTSSAIYTVAQLKYDNAGMAAGTWGCSCRGWTMHVDAMGRRKCKHLTDILARLAKVAAETQMQLDESVVQMLRSARTAFLDLGGGAPVAAPKGSGRRINL